MSSQFGVIYSLAGRVDVGTDQGAASTNTVATLNIDAGVVIFASTGNAYLAVHRGSKIHAVGTSTQPIIFTSEATVKGDSTDKASRQWSGGEQTCQAQPTSRTRVGRGNGGGR